MKRKDVRRILIVAAGLILTCFSASGTGLEGDTSVARPARTPGYVVVRQVILKGNRTTRERTIRREMTLKEGDTIPSVSLERELVRSRQNIFNTKIFNFVTVDTAAVPGSPQADVIVSVTERWYIWPIPIFEISDRNFNVWWETRDFSRLTYGIDLTFNNVRGRNETLRMLLHLGYNQLYGFSYKVPGLNKSQTLGFTVGSGIELNHEVSVMTVNNKPVYRKDSTGYLKKTAYGYAELQYRPDYYSIHFFRLTYSYFFFNDRIISEPGFSLKSSSRQQYITFGYLFRNDHRDAAFYPLTGHIIEAEFSHTMPYAYSRNTFFKLSIRRFWRLHDRWHFASGFTGKATLDEAQPFFLQRGLGYHRDVIRGYEYWVIDGQKFVLFKSDLKFTLLPQKVFRIPFIRTTKFNTVPLALYLNAFADMGYVYNHRHNDPAYRLQGNTLENDFQAGIGLGLDLTTYYDVVVRIEGAVNRLGQTGIFFNFIAPI